MAVINTNLNSVIGNPNGSGSIGMGSLNTTAKPKVTLVAEERTTPPESLAVGQAVKVVTESGKIEYYVGTATGGVSPPISTVSKAAKAVRTAIDGAEKIQLTALSNADKIEISELRDTLEAEGYKTADINAIIKDEKKSNKATLNQYKALMKPAGVQYVTRDTTTGLLGTQETKPATSITSLLTFNDPVVAPKVQANITEANDNVARFQTLYGINQDYYQSGDNSYTGLNPYAIYQAIDKGDKLVFNEATNRYEPTPELLKYKGDQSGYMSGTDISKGSARALGLITNTYTTIGSQANVVKDPDGNYRVYSAQKDANGNFITDAKGNPVDPYGKTNPLVDTGEVDDAGNKIYMQESRDDSKRNKVGVTSLYVQDANGNFTFSGNYDTSYQHIPKANIGKLVAGAALTAAAMYFAQPELANMFSSMLGTDMVFVSALTAPQAGWLASGLASAVVGGAVAGVTGNDVLKSGALAGLGTAFYTALTQAATEAGGWANLRDQMKSGVTTAWDNALAKISPEVRSILGSTDVNSLINDTAQATTELANVGIDATNVASQATTAATNNANMAETLTNAADVAETAGSSLGKIELGAGVDPLTNLPTGIDPLKISTTTGVGQQAGQNALASYVTDPTVSGLISGAPIVPPTTGLDLLNSSQWANIGTAAGGSLLDQATNAIKNTWSSLPAWGQAALVGGGAKLGKDVIENLLTPNPKEVTYPSFTLNNPNIGQSSGGGLPTTMPDWWNNLYARQGVGAGQYLGYDIMKGLNVPADVMSLLGSSAPTTTPAPVATA